MKKQLLQVMVALLLFSCASPRKNFEKGNYDKAYKSSLKKVKSKKATRQDKEILLESLRNIVSTNMAEIKLLEQSKNPEELEVALNLVKQTQKRISEAKKYTSTNFDENLLELDDKDAEISQVLYGHYFDTGLYKLKIGERKNDKFQIQEAYLDFQKAREYQELAILDSLQDVALELGVIYVNIEASATFNTWYNSKIDWVFDDIENESDKFQEITYGSFSGDVDCDISIRFRDLEVLIDDEIIERNDYNQEVIIDNETITDSTGTREVPVFGTVYGSLTVRQFRKIAVAEVDINVSSNNSNCRLSGTNFSRTLEAQVEEIDISGDERAIPNQYRNRRSESVRDLPDDDEMLEELIEEIYAEFASNYF